MPAPAQEVLIPVQHTWGGGQGGGSGEGRGQAASRQEHQAPSALFCRSEPHTTSQETAAHAMRSGTSPMLNGTPPAQPPAPPTPPFFHCLRALRSSLFGAHVRLVRLLRPEGLAGEGVDPHAHVARGHRPRLACGLR